MKKRLYLCLSVAFILCLGLYFKTDASYLFLDLNEMKKREAREKWKREHSKMDHDGNLDASAPRILSTPSDGSVFHAERNVTPLGQIVREVWTPHKPEDYYKVRIGINASGYGEVAFELNKNTADYNIGHWTSEPLQKSPRLPYTYEKTYHTNIINEARAGWTDEISPVTVNIPATGKVWTRSRQVVTYGSRQAAVAAQASATGPSVSFVIGETSYWKWTAGITRDVDAKRYDGKYHVTINDTNIDPGSRSGSLSGPSYASAGDSVTIGLSTNTAFKEVKWYVAAPGVAPLSSYIESDRGSSSSTTESFTYTFPSDATSGDWTITAHISDYWSSSKYLASHTVSVSVSGSGSGSSSSSSSGGSSSGDSSSGDSSSYSSSSDSSSASSSPPSYTPPPSGSLSGPSTAASGNSVTIDLSTDTAFSSVYWYVAAPGDMEVGSSLQMDTGGSSSTTASFTYQLESWAYGYYTITAYINYSDNEVSEASHTVYVTPSGSSW